MLGDTEREIVDLDLRNAVDTSRPSISMFFSGITRLMLSLAVRRVLA